MASNQLTGAEAMVRMLEGHDVRHVLGLCGDTSLPLYDALSRQGGAISHILTRDERSAAYMADGYARVTGRVGVCEGPSGGGATYIPPGVVEANESSIALLAITTDVATTSAGRYALTELDQEALFRPLTKWNRVIRNAARLPADVRAAFRAMTTGRPGAAHLSLPFDVQKAPVDMTEVHADPAFGRFPALPTMPDPEALARAAEVILAADRPVIVCGGGPVGEAEHQVDRGQAQGGVAPRGRQVDRLVAVAGGGEAAVTGPAVGRHGRGPGHGGGEEPHNFEALEDVRELRPRRVPVAISAASWVISASTQSLTCATIHCGV